MSTNPTKHYSSIQENKIAESLGWKVVTGSGSRDCHPGDVESDSWLGECKTHVKRTDKITFNLNVWKKIRDEGASKFKVPVLFVDNGTQLLEYTWCLFPASFISDGNRCAPYPYTVKTNLVFDGQLLRRYRIFDTPSYVTMFEVNFGGVRCCLCEFPYFREMFGEWR